MSLKRGFKAEANRISLRLRRSLGLHPHQPVDLYKVALSLGARVIPLREFASELPEAVNHFSKVEPEAFSAATIAFPNGRKLIVFNCSHLPARCNSSIAHEIAHIALGHNFTLPIDNSGKRVIDRDLEDEANWLGPTILLSNEAALYILRVRMDEAEARAQYGVSAAVLRMRLNASGARIRLERSS